MPPVRGTWNIRVSGPSASRWERGQPLVGPLPRLPVSVVQQATTAQPASAGLGRSRARGWAGGGDPCPRREVPAEEHEARSNRNMARLPDPPHGISRVEAAPMALVVMAERTA